MIFTFFYDLCLLILGLIALPQLLWKCLRYGKYRQSLKMRLGGELPNFSKEKDDFVIWIHAISVGETRAAIPLFQQLRHQFPKAKIFISSTTETGHAEAKRSLLSADGYFFLPLDFSWVVKRLTKKLNPDLLILVESDFWYHLLKYAKKQSARIVLVNGKISERSTKRFQKLSFFTKRIFNHFDRICVQSSLYKERFKSIGIDPQRIEITGNLKFDSFPQPLTSTQRDLLRQELGILPDDRVIVIGSTHAPEEEWLLAALDTAWKTFPSLKVIIVPRHPERFESVATYLKSSGMATLRYSQRSSRKGEESLILIDEMGLLHQCYQIAEVAIVGGSFIAGIGGHNILEPIQCGIPVLFGPHMANQRDLAEIVLEAKAGQQFALQDLSEPLLALLQNQEKYTQLQRNAIRMTDSLLGSTERTLKTILPLVTNKDCD